MRKKGDAELIAIVLLIMVALIIIGLLVYLFFDPFKEQGEDAWLKNKLNNADLTVTDVEFGPGDTDITLTFRSGPGMQELINESEEEVIYTFITVNKTIKTIKVPKVVTVTKSLNVSIVTVDDISGSMLGDKIEELKDASRSFINEILNNSENRLGLVAYSTNVDDSECHDLSNDNESLIAKVDSWNAEGWTCICCGINKAITYFDSVENYKVMIVMSDGQANYECTPHQLDDPPYTEAKNDAIAAAQDAFENHNITVHAIGFGTGADEATLQAIANAGNGSYYFADVSELEKIYKDIQETITDTIMVEENITEFEEEEITIYENITTRVYAPKDVFYFKIVFYTEDETFTKRQNLSDLPGPLESKSIDLSLEPSWGITTKDLIKIEIYAAALNDDGEELLSSKPVAVWEPEGIYSLYNR